MIMKDRISLVYTDAPVAFERNVERLSRYADHLRVAAYAALDEEAVLVVVSKVYHAG
jgi:hypothetical protein